MKEMMNNLLHRLSWRLSLLHLPQDWVLCCDCADSEYIQVTLLAVITIFKWSLFNQKSGILILFSSCSDSHLCHITLQIKTHFWRCGTEKKKSHKSTMNEANLISIHMTPISTSHRHRQLPAWVWKCKRPTQKKITCIETDQLIQHAKLCMP